MVADPALPHQEAVQFLCGDARTVLASLPDQSVHACVCSPPYFGLRSYSDSSHEIGTEQTPQQYVAALVEVFGGVWRVLRDDGLLFVVLGTSFVSRIMESDEYVLRDDLTDEERTYVYAELARHFDAQSKAVSAVRQANASPEPDVPSVLSHSSGTPPKLRREGV